MQNEILQILKTSDRALSIYELKDMLMIESVEGLKELLKELNDLEDNLKVYRTKKDNYLLFQDSHLKIGVLMANKKGFGFVDIDGDEDVFIAPGNMNNAIHGDKVVVEIISKKGIDLEGKILRIMAREFKPMVGEFYIEDGMGYIDLDDDKVKLSIEIDPKFNMGAMPGNKVLVKILNKLKDNNYKGEVIRILGHKNDPGVDILSIVAQAGITDTFSDEVMNEAAYLPDEVNDTEIVGRVDLRDDIIFTIDGNDTKDIDDALSLEILENGNYLLGVHIADVSYYVKAGSKLDDSAYERGTSVYLADRVIPMLPHKLSNGICSLNPGVDRLTITCSMEIDNKGNVVNHDIFESVINSKKQMTYDRVNLILEANTIPDGYEQYADSIRKMKDLADILRINKISRGYIDFDIDESKIIVDDEGKAIDVVLRYRGAGENLIEDFMIAANETVATHLSYMDLPFIYRVHGTPSEEKVGEFVNFLHILGYSVPTKVKNISSRVMQELLDSLRDKKEYPILSSLLLRSMQKAVYSDVNIGHFGIASKCYTHFTSPIRRYPDTTVHRLLRTYLFKHDINKDTINFYSSKLPILAEHTSYKERMSIQCEREVDDMKKAEYMMNHIGEEYTGMISSVMSFGMFVELPNLVEGLVRIQSLGSSYIFDENLFIIKSEHDKKGYRLGDTIRVKVVGASKESRTIDFEIIKESDKRGDIKQKSAL